MSHTVHPYAHRLGIIRDWKSRWFSVDSTYQAFLKCDVLLREWLEKKLRAFFVSSIEMERGRDSLRIVIKASRPGMIIGRSGEGVTKLRADTLSFLRRKKLLGDIKEIKLDIEEVRSPESNAGVVAQMVAQGLERRLPFRRVLKQTAEKVLANRDVSGVRIRLAGRLGGADMARREEVRRGRIPLQKFRADIDFAKFRARTPKGDIGIKVWIYKGDIFEK